MRALAALVVAGGWTAAAVAADPALVAEGRRLAHAADRGNCLACHQIPGDAGAVTQANVGPPLADLARRFPRREALLAQIRDARGANPETVMPPFGTHHILDAAEIERIADYLYQY